MPPWEPRILFCSLNAGHSFNRLLSICRFDRLQRSLSWRFACVWGWVRFVIGSTAAYYSVFQCSVLSAQCSVLSFSSLRFSFQFAVSLSTGRMRVRKIAQSECYCGVSLAKANSDTPKVQCLCSDIPGNLNRETHKKKELLYHGLRFNRLPLAGPFLLADGFQYRCVIKPLNPPRMGELIKRSRSLGARSCLSAWA